MLLLITMAASASAVVAPAPAGSDPSTATPGATPLAADAQNDALARLVGELEDARVNDVCGNYKKN